MLGMLRKPYLGDSFLIFWILLTNKGSCLYKSTFITYNYCLKLQKHLTYVAIV